MAPLSPSLRRSAPARLPRTQTQKPWKRCWRKSRRCLKRNYERNWARIQRIPTGGQHMSNLSERIKNLTPEQQELLRRRMNERAPAPAEVRVAAPASTATLEPSSTRRKVDF